MRYAVSGLGFSGTSMMMHSLGLGGLPLTHNRPDKDDRRHPDGYYEMESQDILSDWEDGSAMKLMGGRILLPYPDDWEISVAYIRRDPHEVFPRIASTAAINQWVHGNDEYLKHIWTCPTFVRVILFWYGDVVQYPERNFKRLQKAGWPIDPLKAMTGVKPELHHQKNRR